MLFTQFNRGFLCSGRTKCPDAVLKIPPRYTMPRHKLFVRSQAAFTLIELLVVIAIIAILIGLLLPAVQKVREAAARAQSQNNLKQLALACHSFHDVNQGLPSAAFFPNPANPLISYSTWIIPIFPYIEQENLHRAWYANPTVAAQYNGITAPAATVVKTLLAPNDALGDTPFEQLAPGANPAFPNGRYVGLTSYGCNGGTAAPLSYVQDGVFHYDTRTKLIEILDGTSQTMLLAERHGFDPNWGALVRRPSNDMRPFSAWAGGPFFAWRSTLAPVNFRLPDFSSSTPPALGSAAYFDLYYRRLFAVGSANPNGANIALCDGSVRFLTTNTSLLTLRELSTRASGNVLNLD